MVSASGIVSPDPRSHAANVTAAHRCGFNKRSIFDRPGDFANDRAGCEAIARRAHLVHPAGNDDGVVLVETLDAGLDDFGWPHCDMVEHAVAAEACDFAELGARRARAKARYLYKVRLQLFVQRLAKRQDESLGGEIDSHLRARLEGRGRGDVDDSAG